MQEEFPTPPSPDIMRTQIYEAERRRLEKKISEIDTQLEALQQQEKSEEIDSSQAKGQRALFTATRGELNKKLNILEANYQHGR